MSNTEALAAKTSFSVVICTRNRVRVVEKAIESVLGQEYPSQLFELILVDNGSTDPTRALIQRYLVSSPISVSCYVEDRVGVSFARNLGAARARHEYIAFLDDDAAAEPGWLAAFDAAIQQYGAQVAGGRVEPVIQQGVEAPLWWSEESIRGLFGLDHSGFLDGRPVVRIRWPLWLGGGNSVYSKELWKEFGNFQITLGPAGKRRRVAEDLDLNVRLERAAVPIYYAHEAVVRHIMTADRLTRCSVLRKAYWAGRTNATANALLGYTSKPASLRQLARAALQLPLFREPARTISGCGLAHAAGYLLQSRLSTLQPGRAGNE
jgi:glycosyltransferase involved in cell wall biosynthesis